MSWTVEIEHAVSAIRMFDAAIVHWHNLGPKILPEILLNGTVDGPIRQLNFNTEMAVKYVKEFMNYMDDKQLECFTTTMEGGRMDTQLKFEFTRYTVKPTSSTTCVVKVETTAEPITGINIDEADLVEDGNAAKKAVVNQFKAVEAYLLTNPDDYTYTYHRGMSRVWERPVSYSSNDKGCDDDEGDDDKDDDDEREGDDECDQGRTFVGASYAQFSWVEGDDECDDDEGDDKDDDGYIPNPPGWSNVERLPKTKRPARG